MLPQEALKKEEENRSSILSKVLTTILSEEEIFEQKPEWRERISHA